jgi:hypothetical protein
MLISHECLSGNDGAGSVSYLRTIKKAANDAGNLLINHHSAKGTILHLTRQ